MNPCTKIIFTLFGLLTLQACQQFDKSTVTSSTEASPNFELTTDTDKERAVVKTATIDMKVANINATIDSIANKLGALQGHMFHIEIMSNELAEVTFQKDLDSQIVQHRIQPTAFLKMKIPVENTNQIVTYLLRSNAVISNFLIDEEDVNESLQNKQAFSQLNEEHELNKSKLAEAKFAKENRISNIETNNNLKTLVHKTKYLWFDVSMKGDPIITQYTRLADAKCQTPFYIKMLKGFTIGWHGLAFVFIGLIHIWPILVLLGILVWIYKFKKNKSIPQKRISLKISNLLNFNNMLK